MMTLSWIHLQRVRRLYKMILRLHRGLPNDIKELGDAYLKDEFRRHKKCNSLQADLFMKEWINYALNLSEQLGIQGPQTAKQLGSSLKEEDLECLKDEQIYQLYELMKATTNILNKDKSNT